MDIIDAHLHLINLNEGDYHWLFNDKPDWIGKKTLQKSFFEDALQTNESSTLTGFVHVEAGFDNTNPWREIAWLEQHCNLPFKSIAFADLAGDFERQLNKLSQYASVAGIRYNLKNNTKKLLSSQATHHYLQTLAEKQLLFETSIDITDRQAVKAMCNVMQKLPDLKVLIDHACLYAECLEWKNNLSLLAEHSQCYVKCSGWEMQWHDQVKLDENSMVKSMAELLLLFGEDRILMGSNFPVCLLKQSYQKLWKLYYQLFILNVFTKEQWLKASFLNANKLFDIKC